MGFLEFLGERVGGTYFWTREKEEMVYKKMIYNCGFLTPFWTCRAEKTLKNYSNNTLGPKKSFFFAFLRFLFFFGHFRGFFLLFMPSFWEYRLFRVRGKNTGGRHAASKNSIFSKLQF
jgi:hypothetical protein